MKTLATTEDKSLAGQPQPSVANMLQAIIEKGVTAENVAVMEQLVGLYERMEAKNAEKAFAASFVALQTDMPVIVATSVIPNRGKYERFEDIMRVVGPLLIKNGFATSFSNHYTDNRITETCHLSHVGGHSKSNSFTVRVGGKADSDTQADCKAATTAKRNALLNALNIVIRQDCLQDNEGNAGNEGETITQEEADSLRRRVKATEANEANFLKFSMSDTYEGISQAMFEQCDAQLRRREEKMAKHPTGERNPDGTFKF